MRLQLSSETRKDFRKSETKRLRREGRIPATVYGRGGDSKSIAVSYDEFAKLLKMPGGRLSLIDLKVDGKVSKAHPVLIKDVQREPVSKNVLHIDFQRLSMNEPVNTAVPVTIVGDAPGLKEGGVLEQVTSELHIRALPDNIPTHIDVDISGLGLGDAVHVGELTIPEGVEVLSPPQENVVAAVRLPVVQIEEVAPEAEEEMEEAAAEAEGAAPEAEEGAGEES